MERQVRDADVVLTLVLEDPLARGDHVAGAGHPRLVHHVEVDQRSRGRRAGVADGLTCGDPRHERPVAATVAVAAAARGTERLPRDHAGPEGRVVRVDARVDDRDRRHRRPAAVHCRPEAREPVRLRPQVLRRVAGGAHRVVERDDEAGDLGQLRDLVRRQLAATIPSRRKLLLDRAQPVDRLLRELGSRSGLDQDVELLVLLGRLENAGGDVRLLVAVARGRGHRQRQRQRDDREDAEPASTERRTRVGAVLAAAIPGSPQRRRAVLAASVPRTPERARAVPARRAPLNP